QSPDSIAAHAVSYLRGLPSVKKAGITPGTTTVWANFTGNFDLIIPNNRATSTMADTLVDPPSAGPAPVHERNAPPGLAPSLRHSTVRRAMVPTSALELPEVATFRAVNAIGTCHINPLPVIKQLLTKGHYTDVNPGLPTVANLKNVKDDGVFYINSHGGAGFDANKVAYYAVWTLDPIDPATLANYKPMVDSHELVGMLETSNDALGNCGKVLHYGFTSKFVRNHMRFKKNSLVIVDACHSASGPAADLRAAFGAVGASAYVGWTKSVDAAFAYKAMKYLLDRLMGLNEITPESPKQRAFNIDDVRTDMETNRNLVTDPYANAVLTVSKLKDDFGLLAPSIQFLSIEDVGENTKLFIAGIFGADPGDGNRAVKMNGQSLDVIAWEPTLITCKLSDDAAGPVTVEVGSGSDPRVSNTVNLTSWEGDVVYERDDPADMRATMTMKVHFRADIHAFREIPHENPWETQVLFSWIDDGSCSITTSGTYTESNPPCGDIYKLLYGADLGKPGSFSPSGSWRYLGSIDTQTHTMQFNLLLTALFKAGTWQHTGPAECAPFTQDMYAGIQPELCLFDDVQGVTAFRMQMTPEFDVTGDNRGPCPAVPLMAPLSAQTAQAKVHWETWTPAFPPDPDAAR
ncbi:MAG TPA: hypothetical protein VJS69_02285, partial [Candidatus Krumholzibacteria bacterium]|nr:hypothetical protein [Candidatus Krumholzibacteria bacterium]